jgi:uncharacterized protein YidB (DUF937 family)
VFPGSHCTNVDLDRRQFGAAGKGFELNIPGTPVELAIDDVTVGDLQVRVAGLDETHLKALSEAGEALPPLTVIRQGAEWILIDGHHTLAVQQSRGQRTVRALQVPEPTDGDLYRLAFDCNARHGKALTLGDRRAFAWHLLRRDPQTSNLEVSRRTGLAPTTVAAIRDEMESGGEVEATDRRVTRGGTTYHYPEPRKPGQLPATGRAATFSDTVAKLVLPAERRGQRTVVQYLQRLSEALGDRRRVKSWTSTEEVAEACRAVLDAGTLAGLAGALGMAADELGALAGVLGYRRQPGSPA